MRKASLAVAVILAAGGATAQDYGKQIFPFSIRDGETLVLRRVTSTSQNCQAMFKRFVGVHVMEAPPELSFKGEGGEVRTSITGHDCSKPVPGVVIYVTAHDVTEAKEMLITVRVNMETSNGPWQNTIRSRILVFPAGKHDQATETSKQ